MTNRPLATSVYSLLVCSMTVPPSVGLAAGGYRGSVQSSAEREKARRTDYVERGREDMMSGDEAMKVKDYEKAQAFYKQACDYIPEAPNTHALRNDALTRF